MAKRNALFSSFHSHAACAFPATKKVWDVPTWLKRQAYTEYGITEYSPATTKSIT